MKHETDKLFFELILVSVGAQTRHTRQPSIEEWQMLYKTAKKQSLVGVCFAGIQKVLSVYPLRGEDPSVIGMPEMLYFTWMGVAAKIQQGNEELNFFVSKTKALLLLQEGKNGAQMQLCGCCDKVYTNAYFF